MLSNKIFNTNSIVNSLYFCTDGLENLFKKISNYQARVTIKILHIFKTILLCAGISSHSRQAVACANIAVNKVNDIFFTKQPRLS